MNHIRLWIRRYGLLAICLAFMPLLTGCLIPFLAFGAFTTVKAVQSFSKSTYDVRFEKPTVYDTNAVARITSIALWPDTKDDLSPFEGGALVSDTMVAECLTASNRLSVITPFTVAQVLKTNGIPPKLTDMLPAEQVREFRTVATKTGADTVLCAAPATMTADGRYFTLKRMSRTYKAKVELYSQAKDAFVWQDTVEAVVKQGSTMPSDAAIQKSVAQALAKRLMAITDRKAAVITDTNRVSSAKHS